MSTQQLRLVGIFVALTLIGAGCYAKTSTSTTNTAQTITTNTKSNTTKNTSSNTTTVTSSVSINNMAFAPTSLSIKVGTTVTWKNYDTVSHTITGKNGGPASGTIVPGSTYTYTFGTTGTFPYHCTIHPSMTGTVTVTK